MLCKYSPTVSNHDAIQPDVLSKAHQTAYRTIFEGGGGGVDTERDDDDGGQENEVHGDENCSEAPEQHVTRFAESSLVVSALSLPPHFAF